MTIAFDLINDAKTYASDTLEASIEAMHNAASALSSIGAPPPAAAPDVTIGVPTPATTTDPAAYTGARFTPVPFSGIPPSLQNVPNLVMPDNPGRAPAVFEYDAPIAPSGAPDLGSIGAAPVQRELEIPAAGDLLAASKAIEKPLLVDIVIPNAPSFREPEFLGVRPDAPPTPPTGLDGMFRAQFSTISPSMRDAINQELDDFLDREFPGTRALQATLIDRLNIYLAGGTGLTAAVENAIYNRTLDKTSSDSRRASRAAWEKAAQMGHTVPGAILLAQQQDLDQLARNANVRAAIDIAIKQAELEQQNIQFAVTHSISLRNMAVNAGMAYYSGLIQINGQAIEYARAVVDAVVKAYEISAKYAEIQARIYEAETRVYEARLRGALAVLEAYQAQVKGLEAQANVNVAKVNAYRAQIEALQAEATIYKAVIEGVTAQAQIERNKVELYQARVQAYGASVNAYSVRWQGYTAAVQGQVARMQVSAERVRAFTAEVQAYEAQVRAKAVEIEGAARANESLIRSYQVSVEAFAALTRAQAEAVHAEIESYGVQLQAYVAKSNAEATHSQAEIAAYSASTQAIIAAAQLHLANLTENNKVLLARAEGLARVSVAAGEVYSAQAQASLSGMNTLAAEVVQATA